jgi:hypothetical protein
MADFDKKLTESDAYLQLLIDQARQVSDGNLQLLIDQACQVSDGYLQLLIDQARQVSEDKTYKVYCDVSCKTAMIVQIRKPS